jgi:hypothetical protein
MSAEPGRVELIEVSRGIARRRSGRPEFAPEPMLVAEPFQGGPMLLASDRWHGFRHPQASKAAGEIIPVAECVRVVLYSSIQAAALGRAAAEAGAGK